MTENQKKQITVLRKQGFSYGKIAAQTGISLNTIKSFCRRYNFMEQAETTILCRFCGKELEGRMDKKFCSRHCRYEWLKKSGQKIRRQKEYRVNCRYCGKEIVSYTKVIRKYCSHNCYINDRFGPVPVIS